MTVSRRAAFFGLALGLPMASQTDALGQALPICGFPQLNLPDGVSLFVNPPQVYKLNSDEPLRMDVTLRSLPYPEELLTILVWQNGTWRIESWTLRHLSSLDIDPVQVLVEPAGPELRGASAAARRLPVDLMAELTPGADPASPGDTKTELKGARLITKIDKVGLVFGEELLAGDLQLRYVGNVRGLANQRVTRLRPRAPIRNLIRQNALVAARAKARYAANQCDGASERLCFFTTAAVDTAGLSDTCWELRTLRAFRDGPMQKRGDWKALVDTYARIAPPIVTAINFRPDARRIWARSWLFGILPAACMAKIGWDAIAVWIYLKLVQKLERFVDPESAQPIGAKAC